MCSNRFQPGKQFMAFDLREMVLRSQGKQLSLLSEYINPQMAKVALR